jgi:elongation factor 3
VILKFLGELSEKATRVLTVEEKELLDKDWIGKNGTKRKMEVCLPLLQ